MAFYEHRGISIKYKPPYKPKETPNYYTEIWIDGRKIKKSLYTGNKAKAQKELFNQLRSYINNLLDKKFEKKSSLRETKIDDAFSKFLNYRKHHIAHSSWCSNKVQLERFFRFLKKDYKEKKVTYVHEITMEDVRFYLNHLRTKDKPNKEISLHRLVGAYNKFFEYCEEMKIISENI